MRNYWLAQREGLAVVESIYERTVVFGRFNLLQRVAKLRINERRRELVVYTQFPNPNHRYTYDNVEPQNDWIREGMVVELHEGGWDGDFVKKLP